MSRSIVKKLAPIFLLILSSEALSQGIAWDYVSLGPLFHFYDSGDDEDSAIGYNLGVAKSLGNNFALFVDRQTIFGDDDTQVTRLNGGLAIRTQIGQREPAEFFGYVGWNSSDLRSRICRSETDPWTGAFIEEVCTEQITEASNVSYGFGVIQLIDRVNEVRFELNTSNLSPSTASIGFRRYGTVRRSFFGLSGTPSFGGSLSFSAVGAGHVVQLDLSMKLLVGGARSAPNPTEPAEKPSRKGRLKLKDEERERLKYLLGHE